PFSNFARSLTLIVECFFLNTAFVKPRFGIRRCRGIWPPSNPRFWLLPERDHIPLFPRPAVLPRPEPGPRPILFVLCVDPGSGLRVLIPDMLLLQDAHQMRHLCDHSASRGRIDDLTNGIQLEEAESFDNELLIFIESDGAAIILNLQFSRCTGSFLLRCHGYPKISSSGFSRSRATSCGSFKLRRPSNVALMTLCGLDVPIDFVRMF